MSDAENWLSGSRDVAPISVTQRPSDTELHFPDGSSLCTALNGDTVDEIVTVPSGKEGCGARVDVHTRPATEEERERSDTERTYYAAEGRPLFVDAVIPSASELADDMRRAVGPIHKPEEPSVDDKELRLWALQTASIAREPELWLPTAEAIFAFAQPLVATHGNDAVRLAVERGMMAAHSADGSSVEGAIALARTFLAFLRPDAAGPSPADAVR